MKDAAFASSAEDVVAIEPVIRRVVAARVANPSDIDDLVQDCLERLLGAHDRLAPETVLPYGIVTARNMVTSHMRTAARRATAAPLIADLREPDRPEDGLLAGEAHTAMETALNQLSAQERADILAYYDAVPATNGGAVEASGALRVRMARIRAKLRLEYLLAFRHAELPSEQCHRVLLAVSAGDTRRQRQLQAGQHLLHCPACATLSEPLSKRSAALTAFTFPVALLARLAAKAKAHPAQAGVSAAAGTAAVATAVIVGSGMLSASPAPARPHPPATAVSTLRPSPSPSPPATIARLSIGGQVVTATRQVRAMVGRRADAAGVTVQSTVTHNGFWIGSPALRMWVQLEGPLRPLHIVAGDHLRFTGIVAANGSTYPAGAGVTGPDATLLRRQGAHIAVDTTNVQVEPNK
ncbi:MAG TPA: sigma-70 family RNA polymerase sigma factor [Streptosporangiaceae bacterium]